jgi:hypothetical protein
MEIIKINKNSSGQNIRMDTLGEGRCMLRPVFLKWVKILVFEACDVWIVVISTVDRSGIKQEWHVAPKYDYLESKVKNVERMKSSVASSPLCL